MFSTIIFLLVALLGGYNVPQAFLTGLSIDFYVGLAFILILGPLGAFILSQSSDAKTVKIGLRALVIAYVAIPVDTLLIYTMYHSANSPHAQSWNDFNVSVVVFVLLLLLWWRDFVRWMIKG